MFRTIRSLSLLAVVTGLATGTHAQTPPAPLPPGTVKFPPVPTPMPAPRVLKINPDLTLDLADKLKDLKLDYNFDFKYDYNYDKIIDGEKIRASIDAARALIDPLQVVPQGTPMPAMAPIPPMTLSMPVMGMIHDNTRFQNDPADSLYRRALATLNNNDYRAAAQRFKELQQKYPQTQYMAHAMYWQAYALNRAGSDAELREALAVLEQLQQKYPNGTRISTGNNGMNGGNWQGGGVQDAGALLMRVRGNLAQRGDQASRQAVAEAASKGTCDREDLSVRSQALSALMQIDPATAMPKVEQILTKRDECSAQLRQYALQIITQRGDEKSVPTLLSVAKQDPSPSVRASALEFVARFPSDEVFNTLETMARGEQNDAVRRSAARMLVGFQSPRARQSVRTIIETDTIPESIRVEMLSRFDESRGSADDAAWLRQSYTRVQSPRVRRAIVNAVGRIGGADSQKWLTDIAGNDQEPAEVRGDAFRRVSANMSVADLTRAYEAAGSQAMRLSIVGSLDKRKEPEALDKMIDIARKSTDPQVKRRVIELLTDRKDPKITAMLIDLIDGK